MFLCSAIFGLFVATFNIKTSSAEPSVTQSHFVVELLAVVTLAPLLETLIFQYGIIKILRNINTFKNNSLTIILISSVLLGLSHFYSLSYIINTTFLGIFLAYAFVVYEEKKLHLIGLCVLSIV